MKEVHWLMNCLALTILIASSCKKPDLVETTDNALYQQAQAYLKKKISSSSVQTAAKVQIHLDNLLNENVQKIKTYKQYEAIICDLASYKLINKNGYDNIFYKILFKLRNGQITDAFVYTIRTNMAAKEINANIGNILRLKDPGFSGEITTNALNDQFLLNIVIKEGKFHKTQELQINPDRKATNARTTEGCIEWYEVTTYYYSDGTSQQVWQYLRTTCSNECGNAGPDQYQTFCDDINGGGTVGNYSDSTDPCKNADSLTINEGYKSRMDSLKALCNQNYETGFYTTRNPDGTFSYTRQQGSIGSASIIPNITIPISSYMHNHYTGELSIFSGSDLRIMYDWLKTGKIADPATFTMSLVTASGTTYIMQIDDIMKFQQFGQNWMVDDLTFEFFERQYQGRYHIYPTSSNDNNLEGFLKMLSAYNTGVKFFVGNINSFSEWNPKKFQFDDSQTSGSIVYSPCN